MATESRLTKAFGARLKAEMMKQGYIAPRSALGADAEQLKKAVGVSSLNTARRYLKGETMARPEHMEKIAQWLGVRVQWLRDGEMPKNENDPDHGVDHAVLAEALAEVQNAAASFDNEITPDMLARATSLLYADLVRGIPAEKKRIYDIFSVLAL